MGYIRHHAIVVTGTYENWIELAHNEAKGLGLHVSEIVDSELNGTRSILVAPDGSKEGWQESGTGDFLRDNFKEWLRSCRYSDGSSPLAWAEIQYGDDEGETKIVSHSDEEPREE